MRLQKLPASEHVAFAVNENELANILEGIFGDHEITHFDVVEGAPCSGRVLYSEQVKRAVPFFLNSPSAVASEFDKLAGEARYPVLHNTENLKKGWEIRTATMFGNSRRVAIVMASWVQ